MAARNATRMVVLLLLAWGLLQAQTGADAPPCCKALSDDPEMHTCPDRAFALFLPRAIEARSFLLTIEHRTGAPAFDSPFRDFLGFDNGGLKIGLGFRWSPMEHLDVGVRRFNNVYEPWDTYEYDVRYQFLRERERFIDAAVVGGLSWFYQDVRPDASGGYVSALAGRSFGDRCYLTTGLILHTSSSYRTKTDTAASASVAVPVSIILSTPSGLSVVAETFWPLPAYYRAGKPSWTAGLKFASYHHTFSFLLSSSPYSSFDGAVTGSDRTDKPVAGFMITRKFGG